MIKIKKYQIEDYISDATQDALDLKADLVNGKVPASQLPSFVDDVIEVANYASLPIPGATGVIYITLDNNKVFRWTGSVYVEIASGVTNLSYTPGVSNGTVNSDTGTDATIPLADTVNAGLFSAAEKSKLDGLELQNLQQVTDLGATTTNTISISTIGNNRALNIEVVGNQPAMFADSLDSDGIQSSSFSGRGVLAYSQISAGLWAESRDSMPIRTFGNGIGTPSVEVNLGNTNKGLVINSGASSTGNFIELDKNGVDKLIVNQQGELTATKLIKEGGTSAQLLAANGDSITAGTNITISGGTISSTGGGGGSQNLQSVTDIGATTTNGISIDTEDTYEIGLSAISSSIGIKGESREAYGVYGTSPLVGVYGNSANGYGVQGNSDNGIAVYGSSGSQIAIQGFSQLGTAVYANSDYGTGLFAGSTEGVAISAYSSLDVGLEVNGNGTIAIEANLGNSNKGLVINSGTSSTGNFIELDKNGVNKLTVDQEGIITSGTVFASSINDYGVSATSTNSDAISAESTDGIGVFGSSINGLGGYFNTVNGANIAEFRTNFVTKTFINSDGELTATKLIKEGGTSAQLLAADGSVITAGTNITISGGTISSTGGAGGSSSVSFYLNGSIASNVAGYQQIGATAVIGAGTDFSLVGNGTIAQFLTDVGSPNRLEIPSGAWNFELWLQSSINNSGTNVHIELYKYDGAFTLIATGVLNPINLQTNTTTNLYVTNVAIPQTTLLATDRLAIRVIASNAVGLHSVTLHTEDSNLCEVITNFVGGVTAINGITQPSQTLATGTTGTDFAVVSSGSTHTFNLPSASATARGVVSTTTQTFAGDKTFIGEIVAYGLTISKGPGEGGAFSASAFDGTAISGYCENGLAGNFDNGNSGNIVNFNSLGVLKASVSNDGTFAGTGLNASGQTINTIASFDASKNVVSLPTATYPSLTELALVKGVSGGSIQTQLNSKVDENTAITGATKTKITYDSKGLVTAGADIATTDISDFNSATRAQVEAELVAGTNITITPSGTGAARQLTIASTGGGGVTPQTGQIIVTSGTSFTVPTGVGITTSTVFNIELIGGGGGGGGVPTAGSSGSGGGGGGYVFIRLTGLSPGNYTCAIGTGGGAATSGGNTTITILGVTYTASGGGAGANAVSSNGGAGGTGTNGDINITGQSGDDSPTSSAAVQSSQGGSPAKGWGLGANGVRNGIAGKAATGYGGGGSAGKQNSTGGSGTGGIIFCQWFNQ